MSERTVDVFFYGLFMDTSVLKNYGINPVNVRQAYVDDFELRIGQRATLLPARGERAYGMVIALKHHELNQLYSGPGLTEYRPEAVLAKIISGGAIPALCYNLTVEPKSGECNPEYALRLKETLRTLSFPATYVESVVRIASRQAR